MKSINEVYDRITSGEQKTIAVAAAEDSEVLKAVSEAGKGIARSVLFGNSKKIVDIMGSLGMDYRDYEIHDAKDASDAALQAVTYVSSGKADILMKGLVVSSTFMKAVINPKEGLRQPGKIINSVAIVEVKELGRLLFISDPGLIPGPDLETKKKIIQNTVEVMNRLGIAQPKVAVLSAMEKVNPKIQSSVDAHELEMMNRRGEIKECIVAGPISFDLAISKQSALHKGYSNPVAGKADMLLVPSLEVGNVLLKSLVYLSHTPLGGFVAGAKAPIVFTSRADSFQTKLNTIAFAVLMAQKGAS